MVGNFSSHFWRYFLFTENIFGVNIFDVRTPPANFSLPKILLSCPVCFFQMWKTVLQTKKFLPQYLYEIRLYNLKIYVLKHLLKFVINGIILDKDLRHIVVQNTFYLFHSFSNNL